MTTIRDFIERHAVLTYYALTFAISWGAMILVIAGKSGIPATAEQAKQLYSSVVLTTLIGPPIASLLVTGLVTGRAGLRELLTRLLHWRVATRWYAVALLTGPLLLTSTLLALLPVSSVFLPGMVASGDKVSVLLVGLAGGLTVGFCEELGWTGFALPRLRGRHGLVATGLVMGVLWGAWHFLSQYWFAGDVSGAVSWAILLPEVVFMFGALPPYRMLMVWVYDRTESLPLAMLMHAGLTASLLIVVPAGITGAPFVTWYVVVTAVLWIVVAAVAVVNRGQFSQRPDVPRVNDTPTAPQTPPRAPAK